MAETLGKYSVKLIRNGEEMEFAQDDIIEVNITEDIFSLCMMGSMRFYDKIGYTEILEVTGVDQVAIVYAEEGITIKKLFLIYDFRSVTEESQLAAASINITTWYLIEYPFIALTAKKYSKSWGENVKGHTIIRDICKNMVGITDFARFEDTNEVFNNFYMPYWTPAESIKWIMKRCSGLSSQLPGYLFYSNGNGINFTTLETLVKDKVREKNNDGSLAKYIFSGGSDSFNKVLEWNLNPPDMHSNKFLSGSIKHGFDSTTKELLKKEYTYKDTVQKYSLLGNTTLFTDISDSKTNVTIDGEPSIKFLDNIYQGEFIKRYSKQFAANFIMRGHTRRYAGMLIDVLWKSVSSTRITHKMYEGLYLVRSITHQFTNGTVVSPSYRQLMVCLKTGYTNVDDKRLLKSGKVISDVQITKE